MIASQNRPPTSLSTGYRHFTSDVNVNGRPTGLRITLELDPSYHESEDPYCASRYQRLLGSISHLFAAHLAVAESAPDIVYKLQKYDQLDRLLLLCLGLYPAADGKPDLELCVARPLLPHLLRPKKGRSKDRFKLPETSHKLWPS